MPATVQFVDIGGLVEGASTGEGLGNKFLANIREVDAIVFVLRAFADDDVPGPSDPLEHLRIVEIELALADLETVEKQIEKRRKAAKRRQVARRRGRRARRGATTSLAEGTPDLPQRPRRASSRALLRRLLPAHQQAGAGDRQRGRGRPRASRRDRWRRCGAELGERPARCIGMCVQLEAEAAQLDAERAGRDARSPRPRRGRAAPVPPRPPTTCSGCAPSSPPARRSPGRGRSGPARRRRSAPGVIHTDFERGFIRAEVIHWDELLELGSWSKARDVGKLRVEGKDYEVADGDVLEIRFNV